MVFPVCCSIRLIIAAASSISLGFFWQPLTKYMRTFWGLTTVNVLYICMFSCIFVGNKVTTTLLLLHSLKRYNFQNYYVEDRYSSFWPAELYTENVEIMVIERMDSKECLAGRKTNINHLFRSPSGWPVMDIGRDLTNSSKCCKLSISWWYWLDTRKWYSKFLHDWSIKICEHTSRGRL